jgi:starch synthase
MVAGLAKAQARAGHEVAVVSPCYPGVRTTARQLEPFDWVADHLLGTDLWRAKVLIERLDDNRTLYFIDQPTFFDRPNLYGERQVQAGVARSVDYADNDRRFIFFCKAVAHLARYLPGKPDILHIHDWQTGLVPLLVRDQASRFPDGWTRPPITVFGLHNIGYQGVFPRSAYPLTNLPWCYFHPEGVEFNGNYNSLKTGLVYADRLVTVSPTYAREIQRPDQGRGLDGVIRARQTCLDGILNGVDYDEWNTDRNPRLAAPYSAADMTGKPANKATLQARLGLPVQPDVPLFATITRLDPEQKGVDILYTALVEMLAHNLQFVLLGNGDPAWENRYTELQRRHPSRVAVQLKFDVDLSHLIEAGADFLLMPSRYEPCGLNQLYSLRYATVPVVRATGGLVDSVLDITDDPNLANGIKFTDYSTAALAKAIRKALALYAEPDLLRHYRLNGMEADFSWDRSAAQYTALYQRLIG